MCPCARHLTVTAPDELGDPLRGWLCRPCVNVCIKRCKSLWIKASAKCPVCKSSILVFYMKAGGNNFALHSKSWWNISGNLQLICILLPRNITTELQAGRQTTRQIIMTQAVPSKSIASAERIKNPLFIGPFLSVFVLLIDVFFSNNLRFNKWLWGNCSNNLILSEKSQLLSQFSFPLAL
jgi:hypothetical protein